MPGTIGQLPARPGGPCLSIPAEFSRLLALDGVPPDGTRRAACRPRPRSAGRSPPGSSWSALDRLERRGPRRAGRPPRAAPGDRAARGRRRADLRGHARAGAGQGRGRVRPPVQRAICPRRPSGEVEIDPEAEMPEPLVGGQARSRRDPGRGAVAGLDPYPRSPEADRQLAELQCRRGRRRRGARPFARCAAH